MNSRLLIPVMVAVAISFLACARDQAKDHGYIIMSASEGKKIDEGFRERIAGIWSEGTSPYSIEAFWKGGEYEAWMYQDATKSRLLKTGKGNWRIQFGRLYIDVYEISPPEPAHSTMDQIVDISDTTLKLIDEDGVKYTMTKLKD